MRIQKYLSGISTRKAIFKNCKEISQIIFKSLQVLHVDLITAI
jgi:hypothetical protein